MNNSEISEIGFLMIKLKQMQEREKGKKSRMHSRRNIKKNVRNRMQRANTKKSFYIENENDEAIFQYSAEEIVMAEKSGRILDGISAFTQAIIAQELMRG